MEALSSLSKTLKKKAAVSDIILYIDDDCKEFLKKHVFLHCLTKYCSFLPIPVAFGKKKEWKDGKQVETNEDNVINETYPLWTRKPVELKDEDYKKFYRELISYGRRTSVLDSSECGLSVQSDRYSVLPESEEQH